MISVILATAVLLMPRMITGEERTLKEDGIVIAEDRSINGEVTLISHRISEGHFQVYGSGEWNDIIIKGVNMGKTKPGYFPNESPITYDDYYRWMVQIRNMNANSIRIFDTHPPEFYRALNDVNLESSTRILLFQGVWFDEGHLSGDMDVFDDVVLSDCKDRIARSIDILHGSYPGGYDADVSDHVLGIIIGLEWDPALVRITDERHAGMGDLNASFIRTVGASPFEIWLASLMESAIDRQNSRYSRMTPVSFVNTQSLDPLRHPSEPFAEEDSIQVHPDHIVAKERFSAGLFSSYHVYPYYPEFMNLEPAYAEYRDPAGGKNNFAGYLNDLRKAHSSPILIAEFGVPSSRGISHRGVHGMDQGENTEAEQGEINARMFGSIVDEGLAGGILFSWQDEWFKQSWNTRNYRNADRSAFWSDMQTPEQSYGLMSFDPAGPTGKLEPSSIADLLSDPGYGTADLFNHLEVTHVHSGPLNWMGLTHDEGGLYLILDYDLTLSEMNTKGENTYIALDVIPDRGSDGLFPASEGSAHFGTDFLIEIAPLEGARMLVHGSCDQFQHDFGHYLAREGGEDLFDFHPIRSIISHGYRMNDGTIQDAEWVETGLLSRGDIVSFKEGSGDLFGVDERSTLIVRIPWGLMNFKDPSRKEVMVDPYSNGEGASIFISGIGAKPFITFGPMLGFRYGPPLTIDNGSALGHSIIPGTDVSITYEWDDWDMPSYTERLKGSYHIMKNAYGRV